MTQTYAEEDQLTLDAVPSGVIRPAGARKSRVRAEMVRAAFGRRSLIKGVLAGGMAIGLASLQVFQVAPRAHAALPTIWWHCNDYAASGGGWDNGYWNICNPCSTPNIATKYCNDNGFHRTDKLWRNGTPGTYTQYSRRRYSCQNKNTWVWRIKNNPSYPNPRDRRCSDGRFRKVRAEDGTVLSKGKTVCQHLMERTGVPNDNRTVTC